MDGSFFLLCVEGSVQVEGRMLEKETSVKIRLIKRIGAEDQVEEKIGPVFCRVVFG